MGIMLGKAQTKKQMNDQTIYQFEVEDITGKAFPLSSLQGKKVMIVNTASKCGLTPQYKELEALYQQYKDKDFVIIGFPANNFLKQEPGTNEEIASFCQVNPLYQFLTQKSKNGVMDSKVSWNFQKYLIGKDGHLEKVIAPKTLPNDTEVIEWINK